MVSKLVQIINKIQPDEIYNLGAMSHVHVSFESPEYTANVDAIGALRILDAIKILKLEGKTKFYQASTSELYGKVMQTPQNESTQFNPKSPYAISKLFAYYATVNYREAYGIFAANGILFNHESPFRGETFVTRKITIAAAKIHYGLESVIYLGNLDAKRDWGHAKDYVEGMWRMLQATEPDTYVLATNRTETVRDFVRLAFKSAGINTAFSGKGEGETAVDTDSGKTVMRVDPAFYRPAEVELLIGDPEKAKTQLGWAPATTLEQLCQMMVDADIRRNELGISF